MQLSREYLPLRPFEGADTTGFSPHDPGGDDTIWVVTFGIGVYPKLTDHWERYRLDDGRVVEIRAGSDGEVGEFRWAFPAPHAAHDVVYMEDVCGTSSYTFTTTPEGHLQIVVPDNSDLKSTGQYLYCEDCHCKVSAADAGRGIRDNWRVLWDLAY